MSDDNFSLPKFITPWNQPIPENPFQVSIKFKTVFQKAVEILQKQYAQLRTVYPTEWIKLSDDCKNFIVQDPGSVTLPSGVFKSLRWNGEIKIGDINNT